MEYINILGLTGVTTPYTIEVCNFFLTNCYTVYYGSQVPPPLIPISVPLPLQGAPILVVRILDSYGCVISKLTVCEDVRASFCDITYNIL